MSKKHFDLRSFLTNNLVALIFIVLIIVSIPLSGFSATYIVNEILSRIARNAFLVFSLILPIMAGMGRRDFYQRNDIPQPRYFQPTPVRPTVKSTKRLRIKLKNLKRYC